jgi:hypothetical protein
MQRMNSQAGYALMDPAFVREVAGDPGVASATMATTGRASRGPWRAWYGETAARFSALAMGIARGHRGPAAPTPRE